MTEPPPVLPFTADLDTGDFFTAGGQGILAICECATCGRMLHMPRRWCHNCAASEVRWREVRPSGTVYSFSVVAHQIHPGFPVPYTVILIDLDDAPGTRLVGRLDGQPAIAIGDAVRGRLVSVGDGVAQPEWALRNHPDD